MRPLRAHQSQAIDQLRSSLARGNRRPMLQMPTGSGKTLTAAAIAASALAKGKRVTFVVPALALIEQTVAAFWAEGLRDVGVIQGSHAMTRRNAPLQIASTQTLARRQRHDADLVIVDEAHVLSSAIVEWMAEEPTKPFIGLSATPWAMGLGKHYDDLIAPVSMGELIELGHLTPFRVFAPSHPDLSKVRTLAGDYRDDDLSTAMEPLTGDVVQTWRERAGGAPTLCFAVDRAHAKHLAERFEAEGVPTAYVDGDSDKLTRETIRMRFASGELKVVCNVGVLTTGVDWDVRCIILARPTKSEMLYVQMVGRGLRPADGKAECLVLDHSDTTLRLGFVTDIHHDALDDGEARTAEEKERTESERGERLPCACPQCGSVKPVGVARCSACGHVSATKGAGLETREGELVELDSRRAKKSNRDATWMEKAAWFAQVKAHASLKGKSAGWAAHAYRDKFGVWPNDGRVRDVKAASEITPEVAGWIKAKAIRYAKGRERAS